MFNCRKSAISICLAIIVFSIVLISTGMVGAQTEIADEIRHKLRMFKGNNITDSNIYAPYFLNDLVNLYEKNNFKPNWIDRDRFTESAVQLREVLDNVEKEGLDPQLYRTEFIKSYFNKENLSAEEKAIADIFLTNSFYLLAAHFTNGVLEPVSLKNDWLSVKKEINIEEFFKKSIQQQNVKSSLYSLLPQNESYRNLRDKLKSLRKVKEDGDWIKVDTSQTLKQGMTAESISQLKLRLKQTGDYTGEMDEIYGERLKESVIAFQKRHGLKPDGVVGPNTFRALNLSAEQLIKTIEINMERLRWLPQSFGENYIFVNIADFTLQVYEKSEIELEMDVIVGREQRSTPVFSDKLSYIVLNPYWHLPKSIAVQDKLPLIKKDINYIPQNNYSVLRFANGSFIEEDYQNINWDSLNKNNFNYFLRQDPGPNNALGRVKFMFPNKFSVYLHDTPSKDLFAQTERSFSSGCIRVEKPFELSEYLLKNNNNWDMNRINSILETNKETTVNLTQKLPIHIVYMTAWVDSEGELQIRNDIYKRDTKVISAFY